MLYKQGNTQVAREQVQQIDKGGHSFDIENVVEETLETNITANTKQSSETDAGLTYEATVATQEEVKIKLFM